MRRSALVACPGRWALFSKRTAAMLAAWAILETACGPGTPARTVVESARPSSSASRVCPRPKPVIPAGCAHKAPADPELRAALEPVRGVLFDRERDAVNMRWSFANTALVQSLNNEQDDEKKSELLEEQTALAKTRDAQLAAINERERCGEPPEAAIASATHSGPQPFFDGDVLVIEGTQPTGYDPTLWVEVVHRVGCTWSAIAGGIPGMKPYRASDGRRLLVGYYRVDQCNSACIVFDFRGETLTPVADVKLKTGDVDVCNLPKQDVLQLIEDERGDLDGLRVLRASSIEEYRWGAEGKLFRTK